MKNHLDRATTERWQKLMSQWESVSFDLANVKSLLDHADAAPADVPRLEQEAARLTDALAALKAEIDQTIKDKQGERDPNRTDLVVATLRSVSTLDPARDEDAPVVRLSERQH